MASAVQSYKLIKKIKDEKFDVDQLHDYSLLIQLSVRDLQIGIVDSESRFVFFEDYIFQNITSSTELLDLIKKLFEAHHLLSAGFWKRVKVSIKNNKFVQVPKALFVEEAAAEYLKLNAKIDDQKDIVLHCHQTKNSAVTIFTADKALHQWLVDLYKNSTVNFIHQSASLIEGMGQASASKTDSPLFVYIDRFKLHIISAKEGKLVYYNQFVVQHFSDYVKYIMLVLNAMKMDQQSSQIVLWGYIGKNSPHAIEFSKYIKNVSFGDRPTNLKFGYLFDEVQEHHFFDLFSMHLLAN